MGYRSIISRACLAGVCLFLLSFHTQCATEKTGFSLHGKILSSIEEPIGTVNLDCETTAKIEDEVVLNFGSIHREIPIGADGMPLNGVVLTVLEDATIKENCEQINFEIACTPSASSLVSVEAINAMVGQATLNPCDCQGDCVTEVPLESIFNTQLALDAVCPIALTVHGIFTFQCLAGFENSELWCVALSVLDALLDCDFPVVEIPDFGGDGGTCGNGQVDANEECDPESAAPFGGCEEGAGRCKTPGEEDQCSCSCLPNTTEHCNNNCDDDEDGLLDCDDPDCFGNFQCGGVEEVCDDGFDNDGDSAVDCVDPDCADDPACFTGGGECCPAGQISCNIFPGSGESTCVIPCQTSGEPVDCAGGQDEANNFCTVAGDVAQLFCGTGTLACPAEDSPSGIPRCAGTCDGEKECCPGGDCSGNAVARDEAFCGCETSCTDGQDNDGNGDIDCADEACTDDPACLGGGTCCPEGTILCGRFGENVTNPFDCAIPCEGTPGSRSDCLLDDGSPILQIPDEDGDVCLPGGKEGEGTPCAAGTFFCTINSQCVIPCDGSPDCMLGSAVDENAVTCGCEKLCDDGIDNDSDTAIDCADADCVGDPACPNDCSAGITCEQAENKVITDGGICLNPGACCATAVGKPITCRDGCCEDL